MAHPSASHSGRLLPRGGPALTQHWHTHYLGLNTIPPDLSEFEIHYFFNFSSAELDAIRSRYTEHHRLAVAIQIGFLKMTGRLLNTLQSILRPVLQHVGKQLGIEAPSLTSVRALYRRRSTLYEHQAWAKAYLGFVDIGDRQQRVLLTLLQREALKAITFSRLVKFAQVWLYEHRFLIARPRALNRLVALALDAAETAQYTGIRHTIPQAVREHWEHAVMQAHPAHGSVLQWLQYVPAKRARLTLSTELEKLEYLRELGVQQYTLEAIPLERQLHLARRMHHYRPARWRHLSDQRRTLELVCFLRATLLQSTDRCIKLAEKRAAEIWRDSLQAAREKPNDSQRATQALLDQIRTLTDDTSLAPEQLRPALKALFAAWDNTRTVRYPSRAAAQRAALTEDARKIRPLLHAMLKLELEGPDDEPVLKALATLRALYAEKPRVLPSEVTAPFARAWRPIIEGSDRERALRGFEAATLWALRQGLRHGTLWVKHGLSYRPPEQLWMPMSQWEASRSRCYARLQLPLNADEYLSALLAHLEAGMAALAEAVGAGAISVDQRVIRLPALKAADHPAQLEAARREVFKAIGKVQFPEVLLTIDSEVRFSWMLLGRAPRSAQELLTVYAALLAHGTDMDASGVALMMPGLSEASILEAMRLCEAERMTHQANAAVLEFMRRHAIVSLWGQGAYASSDMMSLEASRHLWTARVDPRRRTFAVGIYTHVLDQWGIIYDQPIVLNERQAGAAIEGVIRQSAFEIERLAVDTHGHTHIGMALSKLLGFDLCPRLKNLRQRRLHVPRELAVPPCLQGVVERDVSLKQIRAGWDGLVHVASSIEGGWTSAVLALERLGSAARADATYKAGAALGKLLLSLFLCDYLSNPAVRRDILRLLNRGESVHALQRAIHDGRIAPAHGRREEELVAISGSLTLLTNITMAWITHRMQAVLDEREKAHQPLDPAVLRHLGPVHSAHINFRGTFQFPLERFENRLLTGRPGPRPTAHSG